MPEDIPPSSPPPLRPVFAPGSPEADTVADSGVSQVTSTGLPANVAAGLSCLVPPISSIIFLVLEKKQPFVRLWAMQGVIFGVVCFASSFVLSIINLIFAPIPILHALVALLSVFVWLILSIAFLIVWVVMLVKSFSGQEWEIPVIGKFARQQLAKLNF